MKTSFIVCLFISVILEVCVAPGVGRQQKEEIDEYYNIDFLSPREAQDREFDRYLLKVRTVVQHDPAFIKRYQQLMQDESESSTAPYHNMIEGLIPLLSSEVKDRLNLLKKEEVTYQRQLLADNKNHMAGKERNEWNPIHHDNKETFVQDDLTKLMKRYINQQELYDEERREEFSSYAMTKELEHREMMKKGTEKQRVEEEKRYKNHHERKREKMHQPMHKAQMEEVWEEQDGLDKEAFDKKTYFNMHDANSDGYVDKGELETFFLHDLNKAYNESDPDTDPKERDEELERMRESAMKADTNKDGLLSQEEFLKITEDKSFETDKEWIPLTEKKQFSEEDLEDFRSHLDKDGSKKS